MKRILLIVLLSLAANAHTMALRKYTCPLDGTEFESMTDMSGTQFGMRSDLKPLGPTAAPWRVPVCPKDHLPLLKQSFSDDEKAKLSALVGDPAYQAYARTHPSYFLVARELIALGAVHGAVGYAYLEASWQAEGTSLHDEALEGALREYDAELADPAVKGSQRETALLVAVEARRLLGRFDEASAHLAAAEAELGKGRLAEIVQLERKLIEARSREPKDLPRTK